MVIGVARTMKKRPEDFTFPPRNKPSLLVLPVKGENAGLLATHVRIQNSSKPQVDLTEGAHQVDLTEGAHQVDLTEGAHQVDLTEGAHQVDLTEGAHQVDLTLPPSHLTLPHPSTLLSLPSHPPTLPHHLLCRRAVGHLHWSLLSWADSFLESTDTPQHIQFCLQHHP